MDYADPIEYPDTPFPLQKALILQGRRGSEAHGLYIPSTNGGIDDRDIMGIVVPPERYYLGLKEWEGATAIKGVWDVELFEVRKYVRLLMRQNPNVLQLLWLEEEDYLGQKCYCGSELIFNRNLFRHAERARASFVGYARGQMKRMEAFDSAAMYKITHLEKRLTELGVDLARAAEGKYDATKGVIAMELAKEYTGMRRTYHKAYMGPKRWQMVQEIGYDAKNAAHMTRILHLGLEYLETGEIHVRRTWDHDMLIRIKRGQWPLAAVKEHAEEWFAKAEAITPNMPNEMDVDRIEHVLLDIINTHHRHVEYRH